MRTVFECYDCGYKYSAAWYEPTWLAKKQYVTDHGEFCGSVKANEIQQSWINHGAEVERERIIKLLEDERLLCTPTMPCELAYRYSCDCPSLIALIKGENK